jgi:uncharacterized protein YbaR (Trm112 family)/SAM-dependent methyltransferase
MKMGLLEILRCPFCGGRLRLSRHAFLEVQEGAVAHGTLSCPCCAYPVVAGIPYLRDDASAQAAMGLLDKGEKDKALFTLLGLEGSARARFKGLLKKEPTLTYRQAFHLLCREAGRRYFFYRFSDPTFFCSQAVVRAVAQDRRCLAKRVLDLCGDTGHLTRCLVRLAGGAEVILANISFWELWLAKRFLAPPCQPVCCDANKPLPFARETFSLVLCSDAFHYIWQKRLLAGEMMRLAGDGGAVVLTHLHNALCENEAAEMPLAPGHYRDLFEGSDARLFRETDVVKALLARRPLDLSAGPPDEALARENALVLLATRRPELFRVYDCPPPGDRTGTLAVNPLYRLRKAGQRSWLQLRFPSPGLREEYARYNFFPPEEVEWDGGLPQGWPAGRVNGRLRELMERYVLLDLPENYL